MDKWHSIRTDRETVRLNWFEQSNCKSKSLAANNRFVSHEMETANIGSHFFLFFFFFSINLSKGCNKRMASSDRAEKSTSNTASGSLSRIASFRLFFFHFFSLILFFSFILFFFFQIIFFLLRRPQGRYHHIVFRKKIFFRFFSHFWQSWHTDRLNDHENVIFFAFFVCFVRIFFCRKINFVKGLAQTMEPSPHTHLCLKFAHVKLGNTISYHLNFPSQWLRF